MQSEADQLRLPSSSSFELLGLDFLVDSNNKPWLLEVNSTPSLAVEHSDPTTQALIYEQKNEMVVDMVRPASSYMSLNRSRVLLLFVSCLLSLVTLIVGCSAVTSQAAQNCNDFRRLRNISPHRCRLTYCG